MDTSVKESWYLKSVTICLVIAIGSCFPFAAMLAIPLLLYKTALYNFYAASEVDEASLHKV